MATVGPAMFAAATALALAGCSPNDGVDAGGFDADQRAAAQNALDRLEQTALPRRVVAISYQSGEAPATCIVRPVAGMNDVFTLLLAWKPSRPAYRKLPRTLIEATIAEHEPVRFHVSTFSSQRPEPPAVKAALVRAALSHPSEQCEVLEDGQLRLATAA
jgi:hypothetical protein